MENASWLSKRETQQIPVFLTRSHVIPKTAVIIQYSPEDKPKSFLYPHVASGIRNFLYIIHILIFLSTELKNVSFCLWIRPESVQGPFLALHSRTIAISAWGPYVVSGFKTGSCCSCMLKKFLNLCTLSLIQVEDFLSPYCKPDFLLASSSFSYYQ